MQLKLMFDGGSRGNPGIAGCGFVVLRNDQITYQSWAYLGDNVTNNEAEYEGFCRCMQWLELNISTDDHILIQGDSLLVINQFKGEWEVRSENLKPFFKKSQYLATKIGIDHSNVQHILRKKNTIADALANQAMDEKACGELITDV